MLIKRTSPTGAPKPNAATKPNFLSKPAADATARQQPAAPKNAPPNNAPPKNARAARNADYRREAEARSDPLSAALGMANADLLDQDRYLYELMQEAFRSGVQSLAEYRELDLTVKRRVETLKQVARFVTLEQMRAASASDTGEALAGPPAKNPPGKSEVRAKHPTVDPAQRQKPPAT